MPNGNAQNGKTRTRIVTIRLAMEEYQRLKEACAEESARSVSDYSRIAIMHRVRSRVQATLHREELSTLGSRLSQLDAELQRLSFEIGRLMRHDGISRPDVS